MNVTWEDVRHYAEGDVIALGGKKWKLTRKRTTAVAIKRYYWFDYIFDWVAKKIGR